MNAKPKAPTPGAHAASRRGRIAALAALLLVGAASSLPADAQPRIGQGSLLVSTEDIGDPSWSETVVLLLHHDSNGTLGVAINRPTEVRLDEIAPDLGDLPGFDGTVFRGGPVGPTELVFLVRNPPPDVLRNAARILEGVYASGDLRTLPQIVEAGGHESLRLYAGHVEWAAGQLEREIANELWTVTAGSPDRVFSSDPSLLWLRLKNSREELLVEQRPGAARDGRLAAQEGRLAALSRTPRSGPAASTDPR